MPDLVLSEDIEAFQRQFEGLTPEEQRAAYNAVLINLARGEGVPAVKAYAEYVHGWILAPHHIEWLGWLMSGKSVCIIAPPESGKSRLIRTWQEWYIGKNQNSASLHIMNTSKQSKKQVFAVGNVIQNNPRYAIVFPHIKATDNWSKDEIYIARDPNDSMFSRPDATLAGYGVKGSYQGSHVETLIIDDPTDQFDVFSEPTMNEQREIIKGVLIDRLKKSGNFFIILTRWAEEDLVPVFEQLGVKILVYPAWKPERQPYPWDITFTKETIEDDPINEGFTLYLGKPVSLLYADWQNYTELKTVEQQKGPDQFKLTFLCQTEGAIKGERIFPQFKGSEGTNRYYRPFTLAPGERWVRHIIGIDWGTTVSHPAVAVLLGKTNLGRIVARAAWADSTGSSAKLASKIGEWKQQYKVFSARLDRSQWSMADQLSPMGIDVIKGEHYVDVRITAMRTLIDMGSGRDSPIFIVDSNGEDTYRLWSQLQSYRRDEAGDVVELHDDYVDGCLYALCGITAASKSGRGPDVEIGSGGSQRRKRPPPVDYDDFDPRTASLPAGPGRTMADYGRGL